MPAIRGKTSPASLPTRSSKTAIILPRLWSPSSDLISSLVTSPIDPSDISLSPTPQDETGPSSRRRKGPNHIPRPPNAFILFRQHIFRELKSASVEHDQRLFSQIVSTTWGELSTTAKAKWYAAAAEAKAKHAAAYPNYRFSPVVRTDKPRKRKVKRNGPQDKERCRHLGRLIAQDLGILALEHEAKRIDAMMREDVVASSSVQDLGIPASENYSTSIFDATSSEVVDAYNVKTPLPSTPRHSGRCIGIPTHTECSPAGKSFYAPPTPGHQSIDAFPAQLPFPLEGQSAKVESPSMTPQFVQMPLVQESPEVDTQVLFLPSTPSPPPFLSPMPMPANTLAPTSWANHGSLPDIAGMDDEWTWYGAQASPFDDASLSSSPSASSPSSSIPSTPPQQFPQPFLASPLIASSPASAFDPYANPFAIPDLQYPDFPAYPDDGMYAGALPQRTDAWFGMQSVPGELPGMGVEGGLRSEVEGAYDGEQGLGLYDSFMDYTSAKSYMA